jgi:maltose O-acetyltransferase
VSGRASSLQRSVREELANFHPLIWVVTAVSRLLPELAFRRVRTRLLRATGWQIGHGSVLCDTPRICGQGSILDRLSIGRNVFINTGSFIELNDHVVIGDGVAFGQQVMILTTSHYIGTPAERAAEMWTGPVTIGAGAWIGARATILPGVVVGSGAVVAAGALVRRDVPPNTLVAGVPAVVVRQLDG